MIARHALILTALACGLSARAIGDDEAGYSPVGPKADRPPRKVVVGTVIYGPYGTYPGLEARIAKLAGFVDELAAQAERQYPGRGLDLAILPETAVTPNEGKPAAQRAMPLKGPIQESFSALARKHGTYLLVPMDLREEGPEGSFYSNAAILFDRNGAVVGTYRKRHPVAAPGSDSLEDGITPGTECPVFDCDFGKLGVQICWDVQFDDGWKALADAGAEIVAWPSASPATVLPASRAAQHRYYIVSSTWRNNASIFEPTGMIAAQARPPARVLVHELDLSYAILQWSSVLRNGEAMRERYGDAVGFHYDEGEDMGLFWSNDPGTPIGAMVRALGLEELEAQVDRNRRLHDAARPASR